jgi:hypothetical protein
MFTEGAFDHADIAAVLDVCERHARRIIQPMLARWLVASDGKAAGYRLVFLLAKADMLFPGLLAPTRNEMQ